MSGPKRELPPIHIKITGDPSEGLKAIQDVTDAAKQAAKDAAATGKKQAKTTAQEHKQSISHLQEQVKHRKSVQKTIEAIQKTSEKFARQQATEDARVLRRQRMRERNRLQTRRDARLTRRTAMLSGVRGAFGGEGMMGARADMYMHQETLKSMGSGILGLIRPFAQVENYTVQMEAFAGSAEKAKKTVEELQKFAIASPYSLEGVLDASATMMKYGASAEHALEMTKLLGKVAAGNTDKLRLLALGTGQAESVGHLRGQELLQLQNAGFNPLAVAAKEMAGPGADEASIEKMMQLLEENKRAGKLSSKIIKAALQIATSKGGSHAGLLEKQANTLTGLSSQIIETLDLVSIEIVKVFAGDLAIAMKEVKRYLDAVVEWVKANKEVVESYVKMGLQIAEAVAAFSALAMAIAYTKWIMGSLGTVFGPLLKGLIFVASAVISVARGFIFLGNMALTSGIKATVAWILATLPISGTAVAIIAVIAAFAALWVLIEGFSSDRGFYGIFEDGMTAAGNFLGFMWNFGHNFVNIFKFIGENWKLLVYDMLITNNPLISLARMGAKALGMGKGFMGVEETMKNASMGLVGGSPQLDNSMFKFDTPKMDAASLLGVGDGFTGISKALAPYLKAPEGPAVIPDKPNIDFNQFLGKASGGGKGSAAMGNKDHAIRGSGDHAVRMYEYGESVRPQAATDPKQQHQKKVEDLLGNIEKNTRGSASMGTSTIEEAELA